MAVTQVFEQVVHTRLVALSVTDSLLRALRTAGEFPPPSGDVSCHIVRQSAPVVRSFEPSLLLWSFRNASGFLVLDGTFARESAPSVRLPLGAGTYAVRVRSDLYQEAEFTLEWPPRADRSRVPLDAQGRPANVDLLPGSAYALPDVTATPLDLGPTIIRGTLFTAAGAPIRDVPVEALNIAFLAPPELPPLAAADWPFLRTRSNDRGDWAIVLPGRRYLDPSPEGPTPAVPLVLPIVKPITVRIQYPNGPVTDVTANVRLGSEHSLRNTALRGQVLGPGGRPIEGARIDTSLGPASVSRRDGVWFLYFDLNQPAAPAVTVTATTPDGATASQSNVPVEHERTVVVPTFHFS